MTAAQVLIAHVVKLLVLAAIVGIVTRRRAHLCWSFVVYLSAILAWNSLASFWPDYFFTRWWWVGAHGVLDALKMAVAVELGFRTFQAFPGARSTARRLLFLVLTATCVTIVGIPTGSMLAAAADPSYTLSILEWQPRVLTGTIWLMTGLAALVIWYRVPIHAYHKAVLLGFVPYLLIFTTVISLIRTYGWGILDYVQTLEPAAYMAMVAFWTYAAWRTDEAPSLSPALLHRLQPWRA